MKQSSRPVAHTYRYESFGGILRLNRPPSLIWVDQNYMRELGYAESDLWQAPSGLLSAPTEVHLQPTNRCGAGCRACYTDADGPSVASLVEWPVDKFKSVIDRLAQMKVFHLALGGGESVDCLPVFDLAAYAREKGLLPSLTTNGLNLTPDLAKQCRVFETVHVSLDGVKEVYAATRGYDGFDQADRALHLLREAGCKVGINAVFSRLSADRLVELIAYARKVGVKQIELLRFKPAGRAKSWYEAMRPTAEQFDVLLPQLTAAMKRYRVRILVDCSLAPMIYAHRPAAKTMDFFGVTGCLGGNMLLSISPTGRVGPCSFAATEPWDIHDLSGWWKKDEAFRTFRYWKAEAPEPCRSCDYLDLCLGGCHVVAEYVTGRASNPDPDCLFVRRHLAQSAGH